MGPLSTAEHWAALVGPTWAEVDLDAIAANVRAVRELVGPRCRLLAVVKADAYGHGAAEVARTARAAGAEAVGVSTVAEGLALRESGLDGPVLVLAPAWDAELGAALATDLTLTVADLAGARALAEAAARRGVTAVAHVKCDTGMGRYGFLPVELVASAAELRSLDAIRWEGVFTHCARGGDPRAVRRQLARFLTAIEGCAQAGLSFPLRHAAASAALLAVPMARLDMVRVGSLLFGEVPRLRSATAAAAAAGRFRRAFALKTRVGQVRLLPPGAAVGYGSEWRARRPTRVATLPVGFADGLDMVQARRALRLRALLRMVLRRIRRALLRARGRDRGPEVGELSFRGVPLPILGRVGMQQVTVACGAAALSPGDAVTVHVPSTAVGAHVARVYLRDGVPCAVRAGGAAGAAPSQPWPATG